jgi:hypothetical protein
MVSWIATIVVRMSETLTIQRTIMIGASAAMNLAAGSVTGGGWMVARAAYAAGMIASIAIRFYAETQSDYNQWLNSGTP